MRTSKNPQYHEEAVLDIGCSDFVDHESVPQEDRFQRSSCLDINIRGRVWQQEKSKIPYKSLLQKIGGTLVKFRLYEVDK
jgi:hypothetical protein